MPEVLYFWWMVKWRVLYLTLATLATLALHFLASVHWGWAALAGFVGWPLLGTLVTIDDDLPGGWSNPDGKTRPDWVTAGFWSHVFVGLAVAALVAALDANWQSRNAATLAGSGILAAVTSVLLFRRGTRGSSEKLDG